MKKLEYSPIVRRKLKRLKEYLSLEYDNKTAHDILQGITDDADNLKTFENSGVDISKIYNIDTDYRYLFTYHHYLIYRYDEKKVVIVQMFHEREDFMKTLFGISGRSDESIDYWGE